MEILGIIFLLILVHNGDIRKYNFIDIGSVWDYWSPFKFFFYNLKSKLYIIVSMKIYILIEHAKNEFF